MNDKKQKNSSWFFGASYSRTKFWVITLLAIVFLGVPTSILDKVSESQGGGEEVLLVLYFCLSFILINTLSNRIRDYGSNPWLALWSLLPLVGLLQALYFGIKNRQN
ncbi:MAG: DUF805 domain-containing protein [Oceanospirillales bacterium]|nr:DUF805 domain-containing protein [Oceanospirillales bacterium]